MVFSSSIFIFCFLPLVLIAYYALKPWRTAQNVLLLFVSLIFYAWGEPQYILIMLGSIAANYLFGILVGKSSNNIVSKSIVALSVAFNLGILFVFKYLGFFDQNVERFFGIDLFTVNLLLPIGISFYTFQAISYVVDVYRGKGIAQKNPLNVGLYIAFFPQLVAGPIVRYETIAEQIKNRRETFSDFAEGVERFIIGLAKKLIFANAFAVPVDYIFDTSPEMSVLMAWLGALCYTLQIFFDFSGYSDMAIGLGKMFGFHYLENFNYPYVAKSISEFWRRWHISLSSWFRDYVYIPLGGSRVSKSRLVLNLLVVWTLTGIWHGAAWTFIVWGLWYFLLLTFEKLTSITKHLRGKASKNLYQIFTMLCVIMGWVIFRSPSLHASATYFGSMVGLNGIPLVDETSLYLLKNLAVLLPIALLACTPCIPAFKRKIAGTGIERAYRIAKPIAYCALFFVCASCTVISSYNPFIYFNF